MTRILLCLTTTALVSACALPKENTLNRADFRAAEADDAFARNLDFTPADRIPPGEATYEGTVHSDAIVNGVDDFKVLGDLELSVDIAEAGSRAGTSDVTGSITNLNLFDDAENGFDDQRLGGTLTLSGRTDGGRIDARATGVVDAVVADTIGRQSATWQLDLDGDFRDNFENADVVSGDVSGGTVGGSTDDYDVLLTGDGGFFGERQD
ncbi:MAG: hypothetical protein AAFP98_08710 [Pseudomonadota bacterium]